MEVDRDVAEMGKVSGDAGPPIEVGEAEEAVVKRVGGDGESLREMKNLSEQTSTRPTKKSIPVVRVWCQRTSSESD